MKAILRNLIAIFSVLLIGTTALYAQNKVGGKVTDQSGQPLPGVAVLVSGTNTGTMTDENGDYSISGLKSGATLVFTSLGMADQTFAWDGKTARIDVVMTEDVTFLEETVVVGYGTQKKSTMTAAVSAMKGDELMKAPSTDVSQLLAGKLSGISSVQESGEPGLDQASLRIRGSIYGAAYIVDGFPVTNLNDINPADIESISVLKDGASAAVYGLKSAGGVVIVTTKRGQSGKPKISYNASVGASMNANFPEFMDGPQFAYYYNVAQMMDQMASGAIGSESDYVPYFKMSQVELMLNDDPTDGWDNVNYIDKVFGTGLTQKHNVTVQGGSEKTKYFASFGYLGQKGNIDNFNYSKYNVRANIDTELARNFKFTLGLSGVLSNRSTPAFNAGGGDNSAFSGEVGWLSIANQTIQMHPYLPEKYDGLYTASIKKNTSLPQSPLAAIYESGYKKTRGMSVSANTSLSYELPWVKGLVFKVSGVFDYGTSYNKNLNTPYYLMAFNGGDPYKVSDPRGVGAGVNLGEGSSYSQQIVGQGSISYDNTFGKNHLDLLALAEIRDYKSNNLSGYVREIPFHQLPELSYGKPEQNPVMGSSAASRSAGYVFRARYDYDEKYLAEFTGRLDGSYKFAGMLNTRWGFFPSGSIGWRISKEDFMKDVSCVNDFKLRASAGLLGNDSVSEYMFLASYDQSGTKVVLPNGTSYPMYGPSGVPNKDLSWEKSLSTNIGFDLTMWDEKLGLEVDGFYNYIYDILTYQSSGFPSSMGGYYPTWVNQNAMDSKGIDITVSHKNRFMAGSHPFIYGISASITYSKTRWLKYNDDPNIPSGQKRVGTTYGTFLAWQADGLYRSEEEIDNSAWYGTRPCVGDIRYVDLNGDGKIDNQDKTIIGRPNRPELTYGLTLDFAWNGIDFNAQFTGGALFDVSMTGTYYNDMDDNTIWTQTFKENANSPLYLVQNAYSIYNPEGTFPRLTLGGTGHGGDNGLASTFWIRDGKYIRLKSAQVGYTFPQKWMSKARIETLRIFVEGQNLFTIDGLPKGIDPESPGVNNGYYPQQRLLMGGLTITF